MYRFTHTIIDRVYLLMLYVKARGYNLSQIAESVRNTHMTSVAESAAMTRSYRNVMRDGSISPDLRIEEVCEILAKCLNAGGAAAGDGDLVDAIARAIQSPYALNALSGAALEALRNALLLPQELAGLQSRLSAQEMSCNECGKLFLPGEIAVLGYTPGRGQASRFLCTRCQPPQSTACVKCKIGANVPASPKLLKYLKTCTCAGCKVEDTSAVATPATVAGVQQTVTVTGLPGGAVTLGPGDAFTPQDGITFTVSGGAR